MHPNNSTTRHPTLLAYRLCQIGMEVQWVFDLNKLPIFVVFWLGCMFRVVESGVNNFVLGESLYASPPPTMQKVRPLKTCNTFRTFDPGGCMPFQALRYYLSCSWYCHIKQAEFPSPRFPNLLPLFPSTTTNIPDCHHHSCQTINIIPLTTVKMIAEKKSVTTEPVRFEWSVIGYFKPDLLEDHVHRMAQGTFKWLKICQWPPKELQYGHLTVEPMAPCSREERKKAALDKNGRAYLAMTVCVFYVFVSPKYFAEIASLTTFITGPNHCPAQGWTHLCSEEYARPPPYTGFLSVSRTW